MGIQSTQHITREEALTRIVEIAGLILIKNYKELENRSFETDVDVQEFVDSWDPIDLRNISNWTDTMLVDYMDKPFFRHSLFDNYLIIGKEN